MKHESALEPNYAFIKVEKRKKSDTNEKHELINSSHRFSIRGVPLNPDVSFLFDNKNKNKIAFPDDDVKNCFKEEINHLRNDITCMNSVIHDLKTRHDNLLQTVITKAQKDRKEQYSISQKKEFEKHRTDTQNSCNCQKTNKLPMTSRICSLIKKLNFWHRNPETNCQ